jgi:hypothetical protein
MAVATLVRPFRPASSRWRRPNWDAMYQGYCERLSAECPCRKLHPLPMVGVPPQKPIRCRWRCYARKDSAWKRAHPRRGYQEIGSAIVVRCAPATKIARLRVVGRDHPHGPRQRRRRERPLRDAAVAMVQPADARRGDHSAGVSCFDRPRSWRVALQRQVRPIFVVQLNGRIRTISKSSRSTIAGTHYMATRSMFEVVDGGEAVQPRCASVNRTASAPVKKSQTGC